MLSNLIHSLQYLKSCRPHQRLSLQRQRWRNPRQRYWFWLIQQANKKHQEESQQAFKYMPPDKSQIESRYNYRKIEQQPTFRVSCLLFNKSRKKMTQLGIRSSTRLISCLIAQIITRFCRFSLVFPYSRPSSIQNTHSKTWKWTFQRPWLPSMASIGSLKVLTFWI